MPPESSFSIERVCELARLEVDSDESRQIQQQIERILKFIAVLDELDLSAVEPFFGASGPPSKVASSSEIVSQDPLRDDVVRPSTPRDTILKNAPHQDGQFYHVPPVFE